MRPAMTLTLLAVVATAVTLGSTPDRAGQSTGPIETESGAVQNPPLGFRDCADWMR